MSLLSKHIFITKNLPEVQDLNEQVLAAGGLLTAQSLISFMPVSFETAPETDIVFFSSPRGIHFFLEDSKGLDGKVIACVGKSTAETLINRGINPEFIGEDRKSIDEVAKAFKIFAGSRSVLFPSSDITLGTIASIFPRSQVFQLPVYQTELKPIHVNKADVYVFTSPSNVRSFFHVNSISKNSTIISWGDSTSRELDKFNVRSKKLGTPSVKCLIQYLTEN